MQVFIGNLHIILFIISFFVGFFLLIIAPLKYQIRTGKLLFNLGSYNDIEKKFVIWGVVLSFLGIVGSMLMTDMFGYKYTFKDINGNVRIIDSREN